MPASTYDPDNEKIIMSIADTIDWKKMDGLVPAIIQDATNGRVLMLGYMSPESVRKTEADGLACFYSRSRQTLWTKGETSGNTLAVQSLHYDCDQDAILVLARPAGPTCHLGDVSCFAAADLTSTRFFDELETIIRSRLDSDDDDSYTRKLASKGNNYIAQKVGEEAVEVAVAAASDDSAAVIEESADLIYHLTVLLNHRGLSLGDVAAALADRHQSADK